METGNQYKVSIPVHSRNISGYKRFTELLTDKFKEADLYEKFSIQLKYIFDLHKSVYQYVPYAQEQVKNFENDKCLKFIGLIENLFNSSQNYTYEEFCKELGKQLNKLTKSYNEALIELKNAKDEKIAQSYKNCSTYSSPIEQKRVTSTPIKTNRLPNMFDAKSKEHKTTANNSMELKPTGLKFTANPPDKRFSKELYMQDIESDKSKIPKAFEKNIPWAVSQFPDKVLREKLKNCITKHRSLENFVDSDYDAIIRFENLATSYYLELVCSLVTIPQPLADTQEKFIETAKNLNKATDDYHEAISKLIDKFMEKVNVSTKTQLETFKNIVDNLL